MSSLKFKVFLAYEELEYGVLLPNDVNYSNLVRYVKKKFKVGDATQISLSYNIGSISLNIIYDDDVRFFVNEVSGEERENEGTVTDIETDDEGRFKMCFIGFGVAIIPIATGVSQGETGESWTWFLRKLKDCIGEVPNLAIISDRHYAITLACNTVFPNSFHGYCCRHLMMNCGMQSDKFKELYWKTCKAYTPEDFEKLMSDIHALRPDAHQKLVDVGIEKWSRAKCPANRYNYMTSNSVESINALTKDVRKIPITSLMDWFRDLLQKWYYERRQKYEDAPDDELTPWATAKIKYRSLKSSNWSVKGILQYKIYEVQDNHRIHVVYLDKAECTRRRWQLSGLPGHICAVARVEGLTSVNYLAKP
ncbi:transposase, MuDR, MULE transposase domain protein [Tanacetum coccineum]|uniref:Transposase, MuDR, MULE transposase domain protein n=1 Tax=Tanacetum coccineum TaxID=301880 RepID=A0ABQ5EL88_9ASTR